MMYLQLWGLEQLSQETYQQACVETVSYTHLADQNNLYGKEKTEPETDDRRNPFDYGRFQNQLCEGYCLSLIHI